MSDLAQFYIPKRLDEPERFLFWSIDEACIMILPIFIGLMLGHIFVGSLVGVFGFVKWRKLKGSNQTNIIQYLGYWVLPSCIFRLKRTPPSHIRILIG